MRVVRELEIADFAAEKRQKKINKKTTTGRKKKKKRPPFRGNMRAFFGILIVNLGWEGASLEPENRDAKMTRQIFNLFAYTRPKSTFLMISPSKHHFRF